MATDKVFKMKPPWLPELLPEVTEFISTRLRAINTFGNRTPLVLELGAGWSTVWLSNLGVELTSFEHNEGWYKEVRSHLGKNRGCIYLGDPERYANTISDAPVSHFDMVYIDCVDEARIPCLFACLTKVREDGFIVLDDSHWEMFEASIQVMWEMGYKSISWKGEHTRKTGEKKHHQTTIFSKQEFVQ